MFWSYIYQNRHQVSEATAALENAAQLNPADTMLKEFNASDHARAYRLATSGRMDQAIALYRQMIQRVPGDEKAHYNLAHAYKQSGNLPAALHHYQEAVRWKPDYVIAVYNVGLVSEQLGDMDTAQASYRRALALKPDLILALDRLARLLYSGKGSVNQEPLAAIQLAEKANRLTGYKDPYLLETLGMAYAADGRLEDAGEIMQQALDAAGQAKNSRLVRRLNRRLESIRN